MNQDLAKLAVKIIQKLSPPIDELTALSNHIEDTEEKKEFRRKLADIMYLVGYDLLMPIIKQYPELDPDQQKGG